MVIVEDEGVHYKMEYSTSNDIQKIIEQIKKNYQKYEYVSCPDNDDNSALFDINQHEPFSILHTGILYITEILQFDDYKYVFVSMDNSCKISIYKINDVVNEDNRTKFYDDQQYSFRILYETKDIKKLYITSKETVRFHNNLRSNIEYDVIIFC